MLSLLQSSPNGSREGSRPDGATGSDTGVDGRGGGCLAGSCTGVERGDATGEAEPERRGAVAEAGGLEKPRPECSRECRSRDPWHRVVQLKA
jgi:hypothetical protein